MLVLASASPRRTELLRAAGFQFVADAAEIDEAVLPDEPPEAYVRRLAAGKAATVFDRDRMRVVLGADTVVVVAGRILGKPRDAADATDMLRVLSGRDHLVLTGVAIQSLAGLAVEVATTRVWMSALSKGEIATYVATGEPLDKAGAYAIQGLASRFIERIHGSYSNVVGLPIALVYRLLKGYPEVTVTAPADMVTSLDKS